MNNSNVQHILAKIPVLFTKEGNMQIFYNIALCIRILLIQGA